MKGGHIMIVPDQLLEKISGESKEFKKLLDNHYDLKDKIHEYDKLKYLAPQEEIEVKKLKKIKLKEKDIMMHIVSEYQTKQA